MNKEQTKLCRAVCQFFLRAGYSSCPICIQRKIKVEKNNLLNVTPGPPEGPPRQFFIIIISFGMS